LAYIIELPTYCDERGSLTVLEKVLPFPMKRLYWIYGLNENKTRGEHRHKKTWQGIICLQGQCEIIVKKALEEILFFLNKPHQLLILPPEDWHEMRAFENNPLLLVVASQLFDKNDYVSEI
jgi:dTDP-4-dehydrorhamnose 3,5-epimerase-like enzyme